MKCSKCGKEFGEGVNCQNCGIDRVSGLANYSGCSYSEGNNSYDSSSYGGYTSPKTTVCYACSEIIPSDSEYCPHCRKKLYDTCPKCGHRYSSQYSNCNHCGTNRAQYISETEALKREKQYKKDAYYLKRNLTPSTINILALPLTAWILFCLTPFWPFYGYGNLLAIIGVSVLLWGIAAFISGSIGEGKISRWKQEHPNDPCSKYL